MNEEGREPGFYWVLVKGATRPEIARWDESDTIITNVWDGIPRPNHYESWDTCGSDEGYSASEVTVLSQRLEPPRDA